MRQLLRDVVSFCAQKAHGVEDAEHGDTRVGKHGHPHVGYAQSAEYEDRELDGNREHHVFTCVDDRLAR